MASLTRLTRLTRILRLTWLAWAATGSGPSVSPPLEFSTQDGALFRTANGEYFGVRS